jgi:hypothetical protein
MKNSIIIDIDTSLPKPIQIGKRDGTPMPENDDETRKMVIVDIDCLSEALLSLIHMAIVNKYDTQENLIAGLNNKITSYINQNPK